MTNEEAVKILRRIQDPEAWEPQITGTAFEALDMAIKALGRQQAAEPEIIRCRDCKWWDRYNDNNGYCMAAKSCTYTSHWDIQIRRTYNGDFYCAHAEPKEEYKNEEDD